MLSDFWFRIEIVTLFDFWYLYQQKLFQCSKFVMCLNQSNWHFSMHVITRTMDTVAIEYILLGKIEIKCPHASPQLQLFMSVDGLMLKWLKKCLLCILYPIQLLPTHIPLKLLGENTSTFSPVFSFHPRTDPGVLQSFMCICCHGRTSCNWLAATNSNQLTIVCQKCQAISTCAFRV